MGNRIRGENHCIGKEAIMSSATASKSQCLASNEPGRNEAD